jgi:hypothetical protein
MVNEEQFFAWLDGELDPIDASRVAAEVEANAELARRAEQHRTMQRQLKARFDRVVEAPVPEQWTKMVAAGTNVVDFVRAERAPPARKGPSWPQWGALAATLAIGIVTGTMLRPGVSSPVIVEGGKVYAASALGSALDTQLASAPVGDVRIGITFRDQSNALCRTFMNAAASGLACREGKQWQVRGLFGAPEGQGGDYRMAAGMDPNLAALVSSAMAGEPLDAAQEKAARDKGWR